MSQFKQAMEETAISPLTVPKVRIACHLHCLVVQKGYNEAGNVHSTGHVGN
jgi:hypothetical protein